MRKIDKYLEIDISILRRHLDFDYLQLFEVGLIHSSPSFTEYPVPGEVSVPEDNEFKIVSARVMMGLRYDPRVTVTLFPKADLLKNWPYNVFAIFLRHPGTSIVLFLYTTHIPSQTLNTNGIAPAIWKSN
jgi:hypothetical protein